MSRAELRIIRLKFNNLLKFWNHYIIRAHLKPDTPFFIATKCCLEQPFQHFVFHQIRHGNPQLGFAFHGAFVPGQANAIGFEDIVATEDFVFLEALATGGTFSPGFKEAVDVVSVQQALINSWTSRTWEPVTDLGANA